MASMATVMVRVGGHGDTTKDVERVEVGTHRAKLVFSDGSELAVSKQIAASVLEEAGP